MAEAQHIARMIQQKKENVAIPTVQKVEVQGLPKTKDAKPNGTASAEKAASGDKAKSQD